jgi:hypothetical protein
VWRLVLILAAVAGIGLSAVEAGGVQSSVEDLHVYSTSTSLSIPCPITVLPNQVFVRGSETLPMGTLDLAAPATLDTPPPTREVDNGLQEIWDEDDPDQYVTWATPANECGYLLDGQVTLLIDTDGRRQDRLTAALFDCAASAHPRTVLTFPISSSPCQLLDVALADTLPPSAPRDAEGFAVRTVDFVDLNETIAPGRQLRLKVVNQRHSVIFGGGSERDWDLRWGYRSTRQAQLVIVP